jgi:REP-associated tyrosine transposase
MAYDRSTHHRHTIRLPGYDYSDVGVYFLTVCTHERSSLFGEIVDDDMRLNEAGRMVERCWLDIPNHFPQVGLDAFVVMPNHVHGILFIGDRPVGVKDFSPLPRNNSESRRPSGTAPGAIGSIIRGFKIGVTKWFHDNTGRRKVWQRNYYEHILRGEESLGRIRQYINDNPRRWAFDSDNPSADRPESQDAWLK